MKSTAILFMVLVGGVFLLETNKRSRVHFPTHTATHADPGTLAMMALWSLVTTEQAA